jgi:hypothetical protein
LYFDIFSHPLRAHELLRLVHYRAVTEKELLEALDQLVLKGFLHKKDGYYLAHTNFDIIRRRVDGEKLAEKAWEIASRKAALIGGFPFVSSVIISGSLSKNFMDENSDIDYLIVTQSGRLWIARTMLILYKKIFLFNSRKHFCVNYFLDTDHFRLSDHNIFTATELLFATPLYNSGLYNELLSSNSWVMNFLPAFGSRKNAIVSGPEKSSVLKKFSEFLLGGATGDILNRTCMKLFTTWWDRKFRQMDRTRYHRDMRSEKGISKHHPNNFRDQILHAHQEKMDRFSEAFYQSHESVTQKRHEVIN